MREQVVSEVPKNPGGIRNCRLDQLRSVPVGVIKKFTPGEGDPSLKCVYAGFINAKRAHLDTLGQLVIMKRGDSIYVDNPKVIAQKRRVYDDR